jgi:hypothetical protein
MAPGDGRGNVAPPGNGGAITTKDLDGYWVKPVAGVPAGAPLRLRAGRSRPGG